MIDMGNNAEISNVFHLMLIIKEWIYMGREGSIFWWELKGESRIKSQEPSNSLHFLSWLFALDSNF